MFQYAIGRTLAIKNRVPLGLDCGLLNDRTARAKRSNFVFRDYDLHIFDMAARLLERPKIPPIYRLYLWGPPRLLVDSLRRRLLSNSARERSFAFDPAILSLGRTAYLEGYWQSPKYFSSIADTIRDDFRLKDPMSEKSLGLLAEIRSRSAVCVNVRRSDFATSKVHGVMGEGYYGRGIRAIAEKSPIDHIYLFSDDPSWCAKHLTFNYPVTVVGHEYAGQKFGEYLYLMAGCRHFLIPNSTFAWWAAWLNDEPAKTVVAPARWFVDEHTDTRDLFPDSWIRL